MRRVYRIRNLSGELIAEHVRVVLPDGKKNMYWQVPGMPQGGLCGMSTPDLPLYGSERLARLAVGASVAVTEGEKATEALWSLGVNAVGTVTGASSTPGEDALAVLLPFDVVLWPDHDEAGDAHMTRVAATLLRLGGGARRLTWGTEKGDDAADFVVRGGTRVTADLLMQAATPWKLEPADVKPRPRAVYSRADDDSRVTTAKMTMAQVALDRLGAPRKQDARSMWWCCPFHSERTASFKVDLREPFFRCFGCGARGDVFSFLRQLDGLDFKHALSELAPQSDLGGIRGFGA